MKESRKFCVFVKIILIFSTKMRHHKSNVKLYLGTQRKFIKDNKNVLRCHFLRTFLVSLSSLSFPSIEDGWQLYNVQTLYQTWKIIYFRSSEKISLFFFAIKSNLIWYCHRYEEIFPLLIIKKYQKSSHPFLALTTSSEDIFQEG